LASTFNQDVNDFYLSKPTFFGKNCYFLEIKEMNITKIDITIFSLVLVLKIHKFILKLSYIMFMFLSLQLNIYIFFYFSWYTNQPNVKEQISIHLHNLHTFVYIIKFQAAKLSS
jgi:hypothetical protein